MLLLLWTASADAQGGRACWEANSHEASTPAAPANDSTLDVVSSHQAWVNRQQAGSTVNKTTWDSLTESAQKTWDMMEANDKAKILNYAMDRAQRTLSNIDTPTHSANMASTAENGEQDSDDTAPEDSTPSLQANEAQTQISDTKASVHPGDSDA